MFNALDAMLQRWTLALLRRAQPLGIDVVWFAKLMMAMTVIFELASFVAELMLQQPTHVANQANAEGDVTDFIVWRLLWWLVLAVVLKKAWLALPQRAREAAGLSQPVVDLFRTPRVTFMRLASAVLGVWYLVALAFLLAAPVTDRMAINAEFSEVGRRLAFSALFYLLAVVTPPPTREAGRRIAPPVVQFGAVA